MPQSETKRESRPKKKKNESLELLRAITKSMAGAVPGVSQETRDLIDDSLARPLSGFASQVMAEDPSDPGSLVFPPLHNLKRSWNADARRKAGKEPEKMAIPGLIQDTASLPAMFGGGPQWAQDAAASADRIHSGVDEGMNLPPPQGFRQHALNSAGMMGAQIPIAGKAKEIPQISKGALQLLKKYGMKALSSPLEFLSPTVDPKMSNYLLGSAAGGGLGALGDEASEVIDEMSPPRAVSRAKGGKVKLVQNLLQMLKDRGLDPREFDLYDEKGNLDIEETKIVIEDHDEGAMEVDDLIEELGTEDPIEITKRLRQSIIEPDPTANPAESIPRKHAKGGKVGALTEILRSVSMNPDSTVRQTKHVIGDPIEEVLHATNEGQRKGVIGPDEANRIKSLMDSGDEDSLADALIDLQKKLFSVEIPTAPRRTEMVTEIEVPSGRGRLPGVESKIPLLRTPPQVTPIPEVPMRVRPAEPPAGRGLLDETGDRKARGGLTKFRKIIGRNRGK